MTRPKASPSIPRAWLECNQDDRRSNQGQRKVHRPWSSKAVTSLLKLCHHPKANIIILYWLKWRWISSQPYWNTGEREIAYPQDRYSRADIQNNPCWSLNKTPKKKKTNMEPGQLKKKNIFQLPIFRHKVLDLGKDTLHWSPLVLPTRSLSRHGMEGKSHDIGKSLQAADSICKRNDKGKQFVYCNCAWPEVLILSR